eukprot:TRINITY_DN7137_c3_g3_i1.p1 TRINITY_DN7137_c3_g3~~TRINITY_DN7137_c3_g3_i1.p1  ORF type:complete len:785 (-),score=72.77 TRINITY_DN7137_c3_g3_i1:118-2370(-)
MDSVVRSETSCSETGLVESEPRTPRISPLIVILLIVVLGCESALLTAFTSSHTDLGPRLYIELIHLQVYQSRLGGLTAVVVICCFLFDLHLRRDGCKLWLVLPVVLCIADFICSAPQIPDVMLVLGMLFEIFTVCGIQRCCVLCRNVPAQDFRLSAAHAFWMVGAAVLPVWALDFSRNRSRLNLFGIGLSESTWMWLRCSPLLVAYGHFIVSFSLFLRGRVHGPANTRRSSDYKIKKLIGEELTMVAVMVCGMTCVAWVAVDLPHGLQVLVKSVIIYSLFLLLIGATYVVGSFGPETLLSAAKSSHALQYVIFWCKSDAMLAFSLTLICPLLPPFLALNWCRQRVRTKSCRCPLFTTGVRHAWEWFCDRNTTAILIKSMYASVILFVFVEVGPQSVGLFQMLIQQGKALPTIVILPALFLAGLFLFLLPPVPGAPIYVLAGIAICERRQHDNISLMWACIISVLFSFFLKMGGIVLQQKGIGQLLSGNVRVKTMIGIHTAPMKAVRHIMLKRGLSSDKVAVLIGGPDWPTSVLTGILKMSLANTLVGSLPFLIIVCPFALNGCFQSEVNNPDHAAKTRKFLRIGIHLTTLCGPIFLGVNTAWAGYHIQRTLQQHAEKGDQTNWMVDEQEDLVVAQVQEDARIKKLRDEAEAWERIPCWFRLFLLIGTLCSSGLTYLVLVARERKAELIWGIAAFLICLSAVIKVVIRLLCPLTGVSVRLQLPETPNEEQAFCVSAAPLEQHVESSGDGKA